jgi:hypothetical protein
MVDMIYTTFNEQHAKEPKSKTQSKREFFLPWKREDMNSSTVVLSFLLIVIPRLVFQLNDRAAPNQAYGALFMTRLHSNLINLGDCLLALQKRAMRLFNQKIKFLAS